MNGANKARIQEKKDSLVFYVAWNYPEYLDPTADVPQSRSAWQRAGQVHMSFSEDLVWALGV